MYQTDQDTLVSLARQAATNNGLDPLMVCAVCEQESGMRDSNDLETWDPCAMKFEAAFEARYIKPERLDSPSTEQLSRAISFGLMQIMGECARERGFTGHYLTELCIPTIGLQFGCLHLKHLQDFGGGPVQTLQHWNGGGDSNYAAKVMARMQKYSV